MSQCFYLLISIIYKLQVSNQVFCHLFHRWPWLLDLLESIFAKVHTLTFDCSKIFKLQQTNRSPFSTPHEGRSKIAQIESISVCRAVQFQLPFWVRSDVQLQITAICPPTPALDNCSSCHWTSHQFKGLTDLFTNSQQTDPSILLGTNTN